MGTDIYIQILLAVAGICGPQADAEMDRPNYPAVRCHKELLSCISGQVDKLPPHEVAGKLLECVSSQAEQIDRR